MEVLDNERCLIVSKDASINVEDVATGIELMTGDKPHIDSGKKGILTAIARQIISHRKEGGGDVCITQEVGHWAEMLHCCFFVENARSKHRDISANSLRTELFRIISELSQE